MKNGVHVRSVTNTTQEGYPPTVDYFPALGGIDEQRIRNGWHVALKTKISITIFISVDGRIGADE